MKKNILLLIIGVATLAAIGGVIFFVGEKSDNLENQDNSQKTGEVTPPQENGYVDVDTLIKQKEQIDPSDSKIRISRELQTIDFCGKTYKSKEIFVDSVNIIVRLAEIIGDKKGTDLERLVCQTVAESEKNGELSVEIVNVVYGHGEQKEPIRVGEGEYRIIIRGINRDEFFFVSVNDNLINFDGGFSSSKIGTLK